MRVRGPDSFFEKFGSILELRLIDGMEDITP